MADETSNRGPAPACPGPDPDPRRPTRFAMPAGAVDTHAHVIGLPPDYPFVEGRNYTPDGVWRVRYGPVLLGTSGATAGRTEQCVTHHAG